MIEYKIVEEREINGLVYQKVRFYEGAITTENESTINQFGETEIAPITRYRRNAMIEEREYYYEQTTS